MKLIVGAYEVDDDPGRVDLDAAVAFLTTEAYWGRWRTGPEIKEQISQAPRVAGAYDRDGAMVGFARAFGDGGTFYLADVYVQPGHRGAGLGKAVVALMVDEGPYAGNRWMLHTADAHGLYRSFGFTAPSSISLERPRSADRVPDPLDTGVLTGQQVRLEPLGYGHVPGLLAARANGGDLYRWFAPPATEDEARRFVEFALVTRDKRTAVPYAVVRIADGAVIGSTRFHQIDFWPWPDAAHPQPPDVCEIGWTWLSRSVLRTGVNTEMKRLMLTHAFESWQVRSVCFHADARNARSRAALERIGARFEGILRAHRLAIDLIPRDSARYSITAAEWPAVSQQLTELSRR